MGSFVDAQAEAAELIGRLADKCSKGEPLGSMSATMYCTAWVSMVQKKIDGGRFWLYPKSFQCLLDEQSPNGYWNHGGAQGQDVDGILITMAGLLSMLRHRNDTECRGCVFEIAELDARIDSAAAWLAQKLERWDVSRTDHVAFEILIPAHLDLLRAEGVRFQFPGLKELTRLNAIKMAKFVPEILYGNTQTTLIHSLEAFVGKVNFDRMKHRLENGSMMYSPSSTAAYLINASEWDDMAEAYLQNVLDKAEVSENGGFPPAYPSEVFELSWVLSTLLGVGLTPNELGSSNVDLIANSLELSLSQGDGVVGFTSGVMPDADDTAKSISSLYLLGRYDTKPDRMIKTFQDKDYFRTYQAERNPSFSANCNILAALLHFRDPGNYVETIRKVVDYLCTAWFTGSVRDKWNLSEQYSYMLLAQGLTLTLSLWDRQILGDLPIDLVRDRVPLVLAQILSRTLLSQQQDGSWGSDSCEVTAYGLLTLKELSPIPFLSSMATEISAAIKAGRRYLLINHDRWADLSYVWIEKVSYGSATLAQAYTLAAMQDSKSIYAWSGALAGLVNPPMAKGIKFAEFFARLPLYSHLGKDDPTLKLSVLEGYLLLPQLRAVRLDIFPRTDMAEDKWLEYIPLTWTCCNYLRAPVQTELLIDMMHLSMLNYQADEYMEAVVGACFSDKQDIIHALIRQLCADPVVPSSMIPRKRQAVEFESGQTERSTNGHAVTESNGQDPAKEELVGVKKVLAKYIAHILAHPSVVRAPARTRTRLRRELATFLSAHVTQNSDNALFAKQHHIENHVDESGSPQPFTAASSSFYRWIHTTSADHTSAPFSWIFYECLIGKAGAETWEGAKKGYVAEEVGRKLSTMCRMYNDYGSAARDRAEMNVNSLDFPEFHVGVAGGPDKEKEEKRRKADLMYLAEYERECLNSALERLAEMVEPAAMDRVRLFVDVTDLYGQIYVARDIASRLK